MLLVTFTQDRYLSVSKRSLEAAPIGPGGDIPIAVTRLEKRSVFVHVLSSLRISEMLSSDSFRYCVTCYAVIGCARASTNEETIDGVEDLV